ncbi:C40 family peptidase [Lentiprolixibacter aurantiacus]|uniref:C40 family peptidase n=1 Tax=Lentiprolixibacter aurantiacus TaxID=2993939 RepID=A0AAE3MIC8_9FLAO|nr:C40 family peptidase [Lentiprolixibacter aurantiacus]MCX2718076.1 C40 family peptidase [Lentiprolixibacter aurantiacus]
MVRYLVLVFAVFLLIGCGAVKKRTTYGKSRQVTVGASAPEPVLSSAPEEIETPETTLDSHTLKAEQVINTALSYSGVKYKYGGTTTKGMDCSGLLFISFSKHEVDLPRTSHLMADLGRKIRIDEVEKGDLLFFKTNSRGKRINHVGLVVSVNEQEIKFIHATTSRGVIVSSLREGFWNYAFVKATRIL